MEAQPARDDGEKERPLGNGGDGGSPAGGVRYRIGVAEKAGMSQVDRKRVNEKIYELSKNSRFYQNEQRKEEKLKQRIAVMEEKLKQIRERGSLDHSHGGVQRTITDVVKGSDYNHRAGADDNNGTDAVKEEVDRIVNQMEGWRRLDRVYIHVDMDAFYASVEMRDNPALKDVPMAVGGMGMLSTSNYLARAFGVRSAMPGFIGKELCPDLVLVKPNFTKYKEASKQAHSVFREYDPNVQSYSLDEASLDLTEYLTNLMRRTSNPGENDPPYAVDDCAAAEQEGSTLDVSDLGLAELAMRVTNEIRRRVTERTSGLTCSAGIGPNRPLAKIGADMNKPDGTFSLLPASRTSILHFVRNLPVRKVSGIGKVSERLLQVVDVKTCGDLFNQRYLVWQLFTRIMALNFLRLSLGLGTSEMDTDELCEEGALPLKRKGGLLKGRGAKRTRKSMSSERTFRSTRSESDLMEKLAQISNRLAAGMEKADLKARSITVKMKSDRFEVKQRSKMLDFYTRDEAVILMTAGELLRAGPPVPLRLIGVRLACFEGDDEDEDDDHGRRSSIDISTFFSKARKSRDDQTVHCTQDHKEQKEEDTETTEEKEDSDCQHFDSEEDMSPLLVDSEDEADWNESGDMVENCGYSEQPLPAEGTVRDGEGTEKSVSDGEQEDECSLRMLQDLAEEDEEEEEIENSGKEEIMQSGFPSVPLASQFFRRGLTNSPASSVANEREATQQIVINECPPAAIQHRAAAPIAVVASVGNRAQQLEETGTECPVCCRRIYATSEAVLHHHIDRCLKKAAKEETEAKAKPMSILRFFGDSARM